MATEFSGVVLAGGRSSRMGRDKAGLPWGAGTFLDRMIQLLQQAGATRVIVSGDRPAHGGIVDLLPARGPVEGIRSVLADVEGAVVVVPVDLPHLRAARIDDLLARLDTARATMFQGHPLPCALRVDSRARAAIARMCDGRTTGVPVRHMLEALGADVLPLHCPGDDLLACNSPAEWAAIQR